MNFIYHPKSGDRCIAARAGAGIAIVRWQNGCRHVIGGAKITYAAPGRPRATMRKAASDVVAAVGGITWDANGEISIIVPLSAVRQSMEIMDKIAAVVGAHGAADNLASLYAAGAAYIAMDGDHIALSASWGVEAPEIQVDVEPPEERSTDGRWTITVRERPLEDGAVPRTMGSAVAPRCWGAPGLTVPAGTEASMPETMQRFQLIVA